MERSRFSRFNGLHEHIANDYRLRFDTNVKFFALGLRKFKRYLSELSGIGVRL